jgi:hypothetical protein
MSRVYFIAVSLLVCCAQESRTATLEPETALLEEPEVRLCEALDRIKPGDRLPVVMTGIYVVAYEHQFFYDPLQPTCYTNVQPYTWVEFSPDLILPSSMRTRLKNSGRVHLTLRGELYGPKPVGPDDITLPVYIAFANRAGGRRYGHLNGYRTNVDRSSPLLHRGGVRQMTKEQRCSDDDSLRWSARLDGGLTRCRRGRETTRARRAGAGSSDIAIGQ